MRVTGACLGLALVFAACDGPAAPSPTAQPATGSSGPTVDVDIQPVGVTYAFMPSSVTTVVGGRIRWTNSTSTGHTITFTDGFQPPHTNGTFNELLGAAGSVTRTFTAPGTYLYFCSVHPTMTAQVTATAK